MSDQPSCQERFRLVRSNACSALSEPVQVGIDQVDVRFRGHPKFVNRAPANLRSQFRCDRQDHAWFQLREHCSNQVAEDQ